MINPWDCKHPTTAIRFRTRSNGTNACVYQCLTCGREVRQVGRNDRARAVLTSRDPFDEVLRARIEAAYYTHVEEDRQRRAAEWAQEVEDRRAAQAREQAEWWHMYNDYLASAEWRMRRQRVLERDGHMCQGCLTRKATQVHHLSYAHVTREPLFELISICDACHTNIHSK
jgi:hypothetical protein